MEQPAPTRTVSTGVLPTGVLPTRTVSTRALPACVLPVRTVSACVLPALALPGRALPPLRGRSPPGSSATTAA
jgi:hypothetical protein